MGHLLQKTILWPQKSHLIPGQVPALREAGSHKIAISKQRIKALQNGKVQFTVKNYRKQGKKETCTKKAFEFLRRFTLHILPKGFNRIRHYGILASAFKATHKVNIDNQNVLEVGEKRASLLIKCPCCKTGELHTVACFDQRGPPANWLNKISKQNNERQLA